MTASDNKFIRITQKSLFPGVQLLKLSAFAAVGLLNTRAVMAQTAIDLAVPEAVEPAAQPAAPVTAPVAPATPAPTVVPPQVVEPVTPSNVVPTSIEATSAEPTAVDYGTVFIEPEPATPSVGSLLEGVQPADGEAPAVEVISPADYGAAPIDKTDYSVGATMPDVVISERSSDCEFALGTDNQVSTTACRQVERLATAVTSGMAPSQTGGGASAPITIPGVPVSGITTTASREFYNQATQAVVKLQQGEKFIFPLSIPASLTSLFGWRMHPIFAVRRFHSGTDVGAPLGTPVVATQAGRVSLADVAGGYGLMVVLRHNDDTLESRYAHLSRLLVQAGEWVEQGEVIGLVGSTGNSTGPHLHFELRQLTENGWIVLNPDSLLKQTLGTLVQALGNSLVALSGNSTIETADASSDQAVAWQSLPFRPAQPQAN
ncbi:MAG: M23 family metallopeptidase [Cyanobacteria bacterium J06626_26]